MEVYDNERKKDMLSILNSLSSNEFLVVFTTSSRETALELSSSPKEFECERQRLWFFLQESQILTEDEEETLNTESKPQSEELTKNG